MSEVIVPEHEVVAVRTDEGAHDHITGVKLADGTEIAAADLVAAIDRHEAHYIVRCPWHPKPLLLQVRQCPDCTERVVWA